MEEKSEVAIPAHQTRIAKKFDHLRAQNKKAFIAYITAGDPTILETPDIMLSLVDAGVDIIELGIPFSDPLADGPINQQAAERALKAGTTFGNILEMVHKFRERSDVPLVFFSYINPLFAQGFERAVRQSVQAGVDGFIIVDLALEESGQYRKIILEKKADHICLVTPTTPEPRIRRIARASTGFIYCVSRTGVTGFQEGRETNVASLISSIKKVSKLPVAIGFGITNESQARAAAQLGDAVIVGSAIVERFHQEQHTARGRAEAGAWVRKLVAAVKEV